MRSSRGLQCKAPHGATAGGAPSYHDSTFQRVPQVVERDPLELVARDGVHLGRHARHLGEIAVQADLSGDRIARDEELALSQTRHAEDVPAFRDEEHYFIARPEPRDTGRAQASLAVRTLYSFG